MENFSDSDDENRGSYGSSSGNPLLFNKSVPSKSSTTNEPPSDPALISAVLDVRADSHSSVSVEQETPGKPGLGRQDAELNVPGATGTSSDRLVRAARAL